MLMWTEQFGLRVVDREPAHIPPGTYIKYDDQWDYAKNQQILQGGWHVLRHNKKVRGPYKSFTWVRIADVDLPHRIRTEALILGIAI